MDNERSFKGIWIDREIWLNKELTWMEKLFFAEIWSLDNVNGCFASNNYFAKFFQISPSRASQIVNSLIKKEYISAFYEREGKEIKHRILRVNVNKLNRGYLENAEGVFNILRGGYLEYCEESSIKRDIYNSNIDSAEKIKTTSLPTNNKAAGNDNKTIADDRVECDKPKRKEKNSAKREKKRVLPESVEEVRAYVKEKGLNVDADYFWNFFTEGDWIDSKGTPVRNWKQKILTWNRGQGTNTLPGGTERRSVAPVKSERVFMGGREWDSNDPEYKKALAKAIAEKRGGK